MGHEFQFLLLNAGIKSRQVSAANPQSNGIIEQVHKTMGAVIRTLVANNPPATVEAATQLVEQALATAMHATCCASHSSLDNVSPGGLVFRRDMFLDIPLIADIVTLQGLRQQQIDKRLLRANAKRIVHDFQVGELVLKRRDITSADKLKSTFTGPFKIDRVHANGTVTLRLTPQQRERINIRRLQPYRS